MQGLKIIESVVTALLRTFNIYQGEAYERAALLEGYPVFSGIYATLMVLTNIALLLFVAGLILKFFEGPLQRARLSVGRGKYAYIFPCCNEKTLIIAKSIDREDARIIFSCNSDELSPDVHEAIESMKGIYLNDTVVDIIRRCKTKAKGMEVFLFGDDEEENLEQLVKICKELENANKGAAKVFVELSRTPWSLYDDFLEKNHAAAAGHLIINFVRSEENCVYNNLLKTSIFENARPDNGEKKINILLIGMNERNLEMLKAVLHLGQMPGYSISVMVIDEHKGRAALRSVMPEIKDSCETMGDALYKVIYKEEVDLKTSQLEDVISGEFMEYTFAFVNAGEDLENIALALRLNALSVRNFRKNYRIQVSVRDKSAFEKWNSPLIENIEIVGENETVYDYDFITMSDIEKGTIQIHNVRYPQDKPGSPTWVSYCNSEYNRHSVYARTLSFKYKVRIIENEHGGDFGITSTDPVWKEYEHMRWNVYTRTLGYALADDRLLTDGKLSKRVRNVAKVHNDLVPFSALSEEEQNKDALKLTPEVVEILKSI